MRCGGFVLTGGTSSRMGRDKALLPFRGTTFAAHVALRVGEVASKVRILGDPMRHWGVGLEVWKDEVGGCGPMGGLLTALRRTEFDWNLLVACDLPFVEGADLRALAGAAESWDGDCVVAHEPGRGDHPLCAMYHRGALPEVERAMSLKLFKMKDLIAKLRTLRWTAIPASHLVNINTPEQLSQLDEALVSPARGEDGDR